jgi:hypothetical protein
LKASRKGAKEPRRVFSAAIIGPAGVEGDRARLQFFVLAESYFLYQKIATAIRITVMIHRTISLLLFFSSAMK